MAKRAAGTKEYTILQGKVPPQLQKDIIATVLKFLNEAIPNIQETRGRTRLTLSVTLADKKGFTALVVDSATTLSGKPSAYRATLDNGQLLLTSLTGEPTA